MLNPVVGNLYVYESTIDKLIINEDQYSILKQSVPFICLNVVSYEGENYFLLKIIQESKVGNIILYGTELLYRNFKPWIL